MAKNNPSINLVKERVSLADQFFRWALTVGRLVVILTEVIALFTFLYRFSLDRQLIDLRDKVSKEQAIVNYLKDKEATYRNLQDRISIAQELSNQSSEEVSAFKDILSFAPQDLTFNTISLFEEGIRVNADISSVSSLTKFVNSLRDYKGVSTVSVDKIENKPASGVITVTITALYKNNQKLSLK